MRPALLFAPISVLCLLTGCVSDREKQQTRMTDVLGPYIGRPISDHILAKGPPTSVVEVNPRKRLYQWVLTRQRPGAIIPVSGVLIAVPSQQESCMVSFITSTQKSAPALDDWIIESWKWNGAC